MAESAASNGHRLVLFDIDGTLLSAGRAARESILAALTEVYGWSGSADSHDFSGKTDPQIIRELILEAVGDERCEADLRRALDRYLEELSGRLSSESVVPKPGIPLLLERLASEPGVTLALLTGNLERGARLKLEPPGFNAYFPFGAFGSDSESREELPPIAVRRASENLGHHFRGRDVVIIGDSIYDVRCGVPHAATTIAIASGKTSAELLRAENPDHFFGSAEDPGLLKAILT